MELTEIDAERIKAPYTIEEHRAAEAAKLEHASNCFERLGESDAPYRGKKMYGEGAHKANAYLFVEYGSFPPPEHRPYGHSPRPPVTRRCSD